MTLVNRSRRAREKAGLSLGQAARLLGMPRDQLRGIEESDEAFAAANLARLCDIYGVNVEWLSGRSALCDHAALKKVSGAEDLPFRDRDTIAELLAAVSRSSTTS